MSDPARYFAPRIDGPFRTDIAVVVGGAREVWDDLAALMELRGRRWDGIVVAVNDVGCHLPYVDHWATLHPECLTRNRGVEGWEETRRRKCLPGGYVTWSDKDKEHVPVDIRLRMPLPKGSSGMLGTRVAIRTGASRIVLCGIPMTPTGYFAESTVHAPGKTWAGAGGHWQGWVRAPDLDELKLRVRSMSGHTRELLGEPTLAWMEGGHEQAA